MSAMSAVSIGGSVRAMKSWCIGIVDSVCTMTIEDYESVVSVGIGVRQCYESILCQQCWQGGQSGV